MPQPKTNLVGQRFGRLIVIRYVDRTKNYVTRWECICDCDKKIIVQISNLTNGHTKSCGCLKIEIITKHSHSKRKEKSKTYNTWASMIQRCTNPNTLCYRYYGKRGIKVCKRWRNSFENFLEDMGEVPEGCQIDRIDNNGNYCKSNCRWVTRKEQARNKGNNKLLSYCGKTQCLAAWAEYFNIHRNTLSYRLKKGWSIKRALTELSRELKKI